MTDFGNMSTFVFPYDDELVMIMSCLRRFMVPYGYYAGTIVYPI